MSYQLEIDRDECGRWLAEVTGLPGVMAYGANRDEAIRRVEALALRVIGERLEHDESLGAFSAAALVLPVDERTGFESAWGGESLRRVAQLDSGAVTAIPGDVVARKARALLQ